MSIELTNTYNVRLDGRHGEEYFCMTLDWPTFANLRVILEYEINLLKREAHALSNKLPNSDAEYQTDRIWSRVTELKTLLSLFTLPIVEPETESYTLPVLLASAEVGRISVHAVPVYRIRDGPN